MQTSRQGSTAAGALGNAGNRTACSSPTSTVHTAQRLQRQGSGGSTGSGSSYVSSSYYGSAGMQSKPAAVVTEVPGTQHLSIFAVKFVLQQMAVLTLAYDGACRLHSVVEGVTKCCWRSPTGSHYVAMDVCTGPQGQVCVTAWEQWGLLGVQCQYKGAWGWAQKCIKDMCGRMLRSGSGKGMLQKGSSLLVAIISDAKASKGATHHVCSFVLACRWFCWGMTKAASTYTALLQKSS